MAQSIGEIWARGVNDKLQPPKQPLENMNSMTVKPVTDTETEKEKSRFRQGLINKANSASAKPQQGM